MIFALIDLLEKLLGWLKPFAAKQEQATGQAEVVPVAAPEAEPKAEPESEAQPTSRSGDDALRFARSRPDIMQISEVLAETPAENETEAAGNRDRFSSVMSTGEFMLAEAMPDLPVITYLKALLSDERVNRNKTVSKGVYLWNPETRIYGVVKADQKVWDLMFFHYGSQYKFR